MYGAALDEGAHADDEPDAGQQHGPPLLRHPRLHRLQRGAVQQEVLQPSQGTLRVHRTAFQKYVTVTLQTKIMFNQYLMLSIKLFSSLNIKFYIFCSLYYMYNFTWKLSQGEPGRRLIPPLGKPTRSAKSAVLWHWSGRGPTWQASWQSARRSTTAADTPSPTARGVDDRKHSVMFHARQIEPRHSPLRHSWVPADMAIVLLTAYLNVGSGV